MKYIVLTIGLLVVGCATIPVKELTAEEKKVVGEYQSKFNGSTLKYVFLGNGTGEWFLDGDIYIYRLNDDSSITYVAIIRVRDGKRDDSIKFANITFKKTE